MPKQLEFLSAEFNRIKNNLPSLLQRMEQLDRQFWSPSGPWMHMILELDKLSKRKADLNNPAAAGQDPEVRKLIGNVEKAKAEAKKVSAEYWLNAVPLLTPHLRELTSLKEHLDAVIKTKTESLKQSKSLPDLQSLSQHLKSVHDGISKACSEGPCKPSDLLLQ